MDWVGVLGLRWVLLLVDWFGLRCVFAGCLVFEMWVLFLGFGFGLVLGFILSFSVVGGVGVI